MRARLREADDLLRRGRLREAAIKYNELADELEQNGFAVKALAISRQVVEIAHDVPALRSAALHRLVRLYTLLDRRTDAEEARKLIEGDRRKL